MVVEEDDLIERQEYAIYLYLDDLTRGYAGLIVLDKREVGDEEDILHVRNYSWWMDYDPVPDRFSSMSCMLGTFVFTHGTEEILDDEWEDSSEEEIDPLRSEMSPKVADYAIDRIEYLLHTDRREIVLRWLRIAHIEEGLAPQDIKDAKVRDYVRDEVLGFGTDKGWLLEDETRDLLHTFLRQCKVEYETGSGALPGLVIAYSYDGGLVDKEDGWRLYSGLRERSWAKVDCVEGEYEQVCISIGDWDCTCRIYSDGLRWYFQATYAPTQE